MVLTREWWPSPNCSSRGGSSVRLIVVHTTEGFTGENGIYDLAGYFDGDVGASSHVGIDNYHPNLIVEMVSRGNKAWTQCNANPYCVAAEQCGYASWSRDTWLNQKNSLLQNTAQWVAEEAKKFGIPIRELSQSEAQSGVAGVTQHSYLGSYGCGHSDCGSGYPMDKIIEWAKSGTISPEPGGDFMTPAIRIYQGKQFFAYVNLDGQVCVNGGVVDAGSNAKGGVSLDIDQETGRKVVCYVNTSNHVCTYTQDSGSSDWGWSDKKWNAQ